MELDKDLAARQEARLLCRQAEKAQKTLADMSQEQLDGIVEAVARAFSASAVELAELAAAETGFGNPEDKTTKNRFASERVAEAIRGMKTVGVLKEDAREKLWEIGVPVGVIAAIVPSTNPTSTVCYKAMIALKAGNSIVFSPHPKAVDCTLRAARIVAAAAEKAGAPAGSIGCLSLASMAGCQELMGAEQVRLIRQLKEQQLFSLMPEELIATAELRLQYEDYSLSQLASVAVPAITKSGLNHRLKKIVDFARQHLK